MQHRFPELPAMITRRLTLRSPQITDREAIFFMRTDPEVNQYIQRKAPQTLDEIDVFIKDRLQDRETNTAIYWALALKEDPTQCIGAISLWQFSEDKKTAEVGYDLHPKYQGEGYMSEALRAVLEFGFKTLDLNTIKAYTHIDNVPSRTLLEHHAFVLTNQKDIDVPTNVVYSVSITTRCLVNF